MERAHKSKRTSSKQQVAGLHFWQKGPGRSLWNSYPGVVDQKNPWQTILYEELLPSHPHHRRLHPGIKTVTSSFLKGALFMTLFFLLSYRWGPAYPDRTKCLGNTWNKHSTVWGKSNQPTSKTTNKILGSRIQSEKAQMAYNNSPI